METNMKLLIREKRKEIGITQEALAREVGVTQGAVVQWENGAVFPKLILLPKIAKALNCNMDDLIDKSEEAAAAGSTIEPLRKSCTG